MIADDAEKPDAPVVVSVPGAEAAQLAGSEQLAELVEQSEKLLLTLMIAYSESFPLESGERFLITEQMGAAARLFTDSRLQRVAINDALRKRRQ